MLDFKLPLLPLAEVNWLWAMVLFLIFGGGTMVVKMLENMNRTRVELAQLRAQQQTGEGSQREIQALRDELRIVREQLGDLKETATEYDISFDTSLQRMERRVAMLEQVNQEQQRLGG